ncbi:isoaspartyl peptidase/L-asparaginase family protein [Anaerolineales bacterium]
MAPSIIIHGGAWDWADEKDQPKSLVMRHAVEVAWAVLQLGGSALDAVEKAVNVLEDSPLFNAGVGSDLTEKGEVEMDALITDGSHYDFGAIAGVRRVKNPISLARKVMTDTSHRFIIGQGADDLAKEFELPLQANIDFITPEAFESYKTGQMETVGDTVGAVAMDINGNIASATSTGGVSGKMSGRVGDCPIYGAGGYSDNAAGGASCTGQGENIMRVLLAQYAVNRMLHGEDAQTAADHAAAFIASKFETPQTGIILLDKHGQVGFAHTTPKISVGWVNAEGEIQIRMKKA